MSIRVIRNFIVACLITALILLWIVVILLASQGQSWPLIAGAVLVLILLLASILQINGSQDE